MEKNESENNTTNAQSNEIDNFGKLQCAFKMVANKKKRNGLSLKIIMHMISDKILTHKELERKRHR